MFVVECFFYPSAGVVSLTCRIPQTVLHCGFQSKLESSGKCRINHKKGKEIYSKPHTSSFPLLSLYFPLFQRLWKFQHLWQFGRHFFKACKVQKYKGTACWGLFAQKIFGSCLTPSHTSSFPWKTSQGMRGWHIRVPCLCDAVKSSG